MKKKIQNVKRKATWLLLMIINVPIDLVFCIVYVDNSADSHMVPYKRRAKYVRTVIYAFNIRTVDVNLGYHLRTISSTAAGI